MKSYKHLVYADRDLRQQQCADWVIDTFGTAAMDSTEERLLRFAEEALEVLQAGGLSEERIDALKAHVYSRPVGEISQEIGGASVTLMLLAENIGQSVQKCERVEMERVFAKDPAAFRAKHATKVDAGITA